MDVRSELVARIERAAAAGLISQVDRGIRIANVRNAGSDAELDLIRRDLDRLEAAASPSLMAQIAAATTGESAASPMSGPSSSISVPPGAGGLGWLAGRSTAGSPRPRWLLSALLLGAIFVIGVTITWAYRSMRAVMDVGGACADGGPYVSAQPCPDGAWMIGVAVPVLIVAALVGSVLAVTVHAPSPLLVMWMALFGSLGWNFIDYGRHYDSNVGLLVCGIMFWLMALPAVLLLVLSGVLKAHLRATGRARGLALTRTWAWLAAYAVVGGLAVRVGSDWWSRLV